jgi:hypothetical protein
VADQRYDLIINLGDAEKPAPASAEEVRRARDIERGIHPDTGQTLQVDDIPSLRPIEQLRIQMDFPFFVAAVLSRPWVRCELERLGAAYRATFNPLYLDEAIVLARECRLAWPQWLRELIEASAARRLRVVEEGLQKKEQAAQIANKTFGKTWHDAPIYKWDRARRDLLIDVMDECYRAQGLSKAESHRRIKADLKQIPESISISTIKTILRRDRSKQQ